MPNPYERESYIKALEQELKVPLTLQMRQAAEVAVVLANLHSRDQEKNEEDLLVLEHILNSPLEDLSFNRIKEEDFTASEVAAVFLVKIRHENLLSQRLLNATSPKGNTATSIRLDGYDFTSDPSLSQTFKRLRYVSSLQKRTDPVKDIVSEGTRLGGGEFLNLLGLDNIPLMPYRKDLGKIVMDLEQTWDKKGFRGRLPTRVCEVAALYVYPNFQDTPIISLEVTRKP